MAGCPGLSIRLVAGSPVRTPAATRAHPGGQGVSETPPVRSVKEIGVMKGSVFHLIRMVKVAR